MISRQYTSKTSSNTVIKSCNACITKQRLDLTSKSIYQYSFLKVSSDVFTNQVSYAVIATKQIVTVWDAIAPLL